jgi:hypothetical protein
MASGFVSACSSGKKADLAKLDSMLEGRVVLPSSPGWDHARLLHDPDDFFRLARSIPAG